MLLRYTRPHAEDYESNSHTKISVIKLLPICTKGTFAAKGFAAALWKVPPLFSLTQTYTQVSCPVLLLLLLLIAINMPQGGLQYKKHMNVEDILPPQAWIPQVAQHSQAQICQVDGRELWG